MPEEVAPICLGIESDNLNRLHAVCSVIKQQLDVFRTSTEDREVDALRRPVCPGWESRTRPCGIDFQGRIDLKEYAAPRPIEIALRSDIKVARSG